jgi:hypothetical protein
MSFKVHFFKASFDKAPTLYRKGIYKEVPTPARKPQRRKSAIHTNTFFREKTFDNNRFELSGIVLF